MIKTLNWLRIALGGLAEYHATAIAHDILSTETLESKFPIFRQENILWLQNDMIKFLESSIAVGTMFLKSIPGEEETSR